MKKIFSISCVILGLTILILGCRTRIDSKALSSITSLAQITPADIKTQSISVYDSTAVNGVSGVVKIEVDFPRDGNFFVMNNIREWMSEQLGGSYESNLDNGNKMIDFYASSFMKDMKENVIPDLPKIDDMNCYKSVKITKLYETDSYITYIYTQEGYSGGAHGWYILQGQTFRKTDGRRIDFDIFREELNDNLAQLVRDNIYSQYFDSDTEQIENGLTIENSDYFPLPLTAPIFMEDGVEFIYQQYEISCYAAGLPACVISYDLIEPFLTQSGKALIGNTNVAEN